MRNAKRAVATIAENETQVHDFLTKKNIDSRSVFETWLAEERSYLQTKQKPKAGDDKYLEREYVRLLRKLSEAE